MSSSRPLAIATFLVSVAACHAHAPTTALTPPLAPFRPEIHALALGVDSVQLAVRVVLRNPFSDTLTLETTCGGVALRLEYADGVRWRPAIGGLHLDTVPANLGRPSVNPNPHPYLALDRSMNAGCNRVEHLGLGRDCQWRGRRTPRRGWPLVLWRQSAPAPPRQRRSLWTNGVTPIP